MQRPLAEVQADLADVLARVYQDRLGRPARRVEVTLAGSTVLARFVGAIPPAMQRLAETPEGTSLLREWEGRLWAGAAGLLKETLGRLTGAAVTTLDVVADPANGDLLLVFGLDRNVGSDPPPVTR